VTSYKPRWFTRPQTVTHPSTNPAVHGRKSNSRPVDHKSDALTITPPSHHKGWRINKPLQISRQADYGPLNGHLCRWPPLLFASAIPSYQQRRWRHVLIPPRRSVTLARFGWVPDISSPRTKAPPPGQKPPENSYLGQKPPRSNLLQEKPHLWKVNM